MKATTEARFAEWLKAARTEAGMSQQKVADALRAQGFTVFRQSTIGKIEAGSRPVLLTEAVAMAELLGETLDTALGLSAVSPQVIASRQAASRRLVLLQQISAAIAAELGGAH